MSRLLIVSNRLPITVTQKGDRLEVVKSTGGLATGLSGPHERGDGLWIGWPGDTGDLTSGKRAEVAEQPAVIAEAQSLRAGGDDCALILGVDRLDYTKGITRRLLAFEELIRRHPHLSERVRLIQVAVPSRIDFRLDAAGRMHVLEANPNPQLANGEDFADSAERAGLSYGDLLQAIINMALARRQV